MPCVVDAETTRDERHCNDEKNPINVSHVVHDGPLQVANVVDAFVAQPAFCERPSLDGLDGLPVLLD